MRLLSKLLLFGLGVTLTPVVHAEDNCLLILSSLTPMEKMLIPSLETAFASNGICLNIEYAPPKRATVMLRDGQADGEMMKVADYQAELGAAAFAVSEPLMSGFGLLVTKGLDPQSPDELQGQWIAAIDGYQWHLDILPNDATLISIETYEAGLKMLETGRISGLFIDSVHFANHTEEGHGFSALKVTPKISGYLYLHTRHRKLSEPVAKIIKTWKADHARRQSRDRTQ